MSNNKKKRKLYVFRAKERKKEKKLIYQDNLTLSQSTKSLRCALLRLQLLCNTPILAAWYLPTASTSMSKQE